MGRVPALHVEELVLDQRDARAGRYLVLGHRAVEDAAALVERELLAQREPDALREDIETNLRSLEIDQLAAVNLRVMYPESEDPSKPARVNRELFDRQLTAMIQAHDYP